ncbi:MAG TPA: hypothetical protein VFR58_08930 [Flavisolibacter sp.]|nr:hypothetical protein [Flavisolibacter sp.]
MKKIFILGALAALTLSSCDKDDSKNDSAGTESPRRLKRMTQEEGNKTTVFNFTYDANKRLTAVRSTDNSQYTLFSYDAGGNLTKVEELEEGFKNIFTYAYSGNVPVSGTFKNWMLHAGEPDELIEDDVLTYTVQNGQVTKIHYHMLLGDETESYLLSYANGNLVKAETENSDNYIGVFTYGNKKPIVSPVSKYVLDPAGFSLLYASKNELLSASFDFPGTWLDRSTTIQYTYDSKGYVLTSNDGDMQVRYEYE